MNIFPIERAQDDDLNGVNTITKRGLHHLSGHRIVSMQEGVHMVDDQELVICSDCFTYVSITQGQVAPRFLFLGIFLTLSKDKTANNLNNL